MKILQDLKFIARVLCVILVVLVIHEYGHYSEMKKHGVEVKEFSIGLGPLIFQKIKNDGVLLSLRLIPIGAYVKSSQKGSEKLSKLSIFELFNIVSAGVRNNIFTGWCLVIAMQVLSVLRRRITFTAFIKSFLFSPFRILIIFLGFTVSFFHRCGISFVKKFNFEVYGIKKNEHINRLLWWSFCVGFLNFLPARFFDGQKLFYVTSFLLVPFFPTIHHFLLAFLQIVGPLLLLFIFFGIRIGEIVNYND